MTSSTSYNESVISYYDKAEVSYRDIWDLERSMALHYGYWDSTVKTFPESLHKMNQVLASVLNPRPGSTILDAGCGVGGSSIFLASAFNCKTTGISLSKKQVESAKKNAAKNKVSQQCLFQVGDFLQTNFEDNSFDGIWALESVCHATDKGQFLKEAFRILKPGGRLIMADGFKKKNLSTAENSMLQQWLSGWSIIDLESLENMQANAHDAGFVDVYTEDLTKNVYPTSLRMYRFGLMAKYYGKMVTLFGKKYGNAYTINNTRGAIFQYLTLKRKIWHYCLFSAEKKSQV